ncbi:MAG: response regulator transcription factor [Patulibacter sp.]
MRTLIVDDHDLVRHGVRAVLSSDPRIDVVADVATGGAAVHAARTLAPDLVLMDLRLPDMRGEDATREIVRLCPGTDVVIVSTYLSEDTVRSALEAGAIGYVTKSAGLSELRTVLDRILRGEHRAAAGQQIVEHLYSLGPDVDRVAVTPQQERVLELAARGCTYREVGQRLFIAESTVRFHIQKLKAKFGARTKTELIATAIRTGILAPAAEAGVPYLERAS